MHIINQEHVSAIRKIYTDGMNVRDWVNSAIQICEQTQQHQLLCLIRTTPFTIVEITKYTVGLFHDDINTSIIPLVESGECAQLMDRFYIFTNPVDALVFKLYWQQH